MVFQFNGLTADESASIIKDLATTYDFINQKQLTKAWENYAIRELFKSTPKKEYTRKIKLFQTAAEKLAQSISELPALAHFKASSDFSVLTMDDDYNSVDLDDLVAPLEKIADIDYMQLFHHTSKIHGQQAFVEAIATMYRESTGKTGVTYDAVQERVTGTLVDALENIFNNLNIPFVSREALAQRIRRSRPPETTK